MEDIFIKLFLILIILTLYPNGEQSKLLVIYLQSQEYSFLWKFIETSKWNTFIFDFSRLQTYDFYLQCFQIQKVFFQDHPRTEGWMKAIPKKENVGTIFQCRTLCRNSRDNSVKIWSGFEKGKSKSNFIDESAKEYSSHRKTGI